MCADWERVRIGNVSGLGTCLDLDVFTRSTRYPRKKVREEEKGCGTAYCETLFVLDR